MTINAGLRRTDGVGIPLRGVAVDGKVYGGHAAVTVRQRYHNTEPKPVETVYTFPLPSDATLVGFAMLCDGRRIEGIVKERQEAFRQYDDAISAGHGAALLEQERANVFTASVGNLLPGEETLVEVQYVQRLQADEGALRWMIPTLVAPRYIPGTPKGDRTGDGWAEPTDRVPDADRVTPRIGAVDYGLTLDLLFDLGSDISVESPSHELTIMQEEKKQVRVSFTAEEVALDRDVVIIVRGITDGPLSAAAVHRPADAKESGVLVLTVVPDLSGDVRTVIRQNVVFLIDISGSMMGTSIREARAALRLCLRHLREGDHFNVIAFQSTSTKFSSQPVPFTQQTLDEADAWVQALVADGGTEMREPLVEAVRQVPDGLVVLLTDGQVGNEDEILREVAAARGRTRVYSFGIGTNVSDMLLRDLAKHTGGAVEFIYPGERIDKKVVAQFARAIAPRITDVTVSFGGSDIAVSQLVPSEPPALVDGEPWVLFGRVTGHGRGHAEVRGRYGNEPFSLVIPVDLSDAMSRPLLVKFWASEQVRDWEAAAVRGRRAERLKERIVELAVQYGIVSRYTSFLAVEHRSGERRASGQPETRVIPVSLPAGWAMFGAKKTVGLHPMFARMSFSSALPAAALSSSVSTVKETGLRQQVLRRLPQVPSIQGLVEPQAKAEEQQASDALVVLLSQQLASGLWDEPGRDSDDVRGAWATARALLKLLQAGVTSGHPLYGAQVKKAVEALIRLAARLATSDAQVAAFALGVAWLASTGYRTRSKIETVVAGHTALAVLRSHLGDERAARTYVEQLAS